MAKDHIDPGATLNKLMILICEKQRLKQLSIAYFRDAEPPKRWMVHGRTRRGFGVTLQEALLNMVPVSREEKPASSFVGKWRLKPTKAKPARRAPT